MPYSYSSVPKMLMVSFVPEKLDELFDGDMKHFHHHFNCMLDNLTPYYPQISPHVKNINDPSGKSMFYILKSLEFQQESYWSST